jgi:CelD/BcsL family acetyltransferase involved in cellulose biosynthesis
VERGLPKSRFPERAAPQALAGLAPLTAHPDAIRVERLTDPSALEQLGTEWSLLATRTEDLSVFQTYEWQRTWWEHFGHGSLYLLLAYDGSELVAILPLYRSAEPLPLMRPLSRLRLIGMGGETTPDYLGQIAPRALADRTAEAFLHYLLENRSDWDTLELATLAETSALLARLRSLNPGPGHHARFDAPERIFFAELPATWEQYMAALSPHARQSVRQVRRKFLANKGARLRRWQDVATLDVAIDQLITLHTQRWQGRSEHHSFSTDRYNAFHRALMHLFLQRDWLRLYCVELDKQIIGMFYGYAFRGVLYHFQGGFDPRYEHMRIGQCVMAYAIESGIAEGCNCLDMLRGAYEYKRRWAPQVRETYTWTVEQRNLATLTSRFRNRLITPAFSRAARLFRPAVSQRAAPETEGAG